ncbi:uncharacterized protein LOC143885862 [Tasmannia lanceolata]|uniref:uncharacterized protein LOC143885862 n=1 Tax=Tasmannia lanceolata TaxID=3420 RepID=UPI0040647887
MVAALGCFISKAAERCIPFFNAVKGIKTAPWTSDCQVVFEELKKYLSSPPLLAKPESGEELLLYLSVSPMALAAVLIREEHNKQKPVYYVSKVLHDAETRYQRVEKLAYALIKAARKLRLPAIKAQVLADFVAECTIPRQTITSETVQTPVVEEITTPGGQAEVEETETARAKSIPILADLNPSSDEPLWEVYVDGSSNKTGWGAGLILIGPENFVLDYALRFRFCDSNNEAEYEALITGMNLAVQTRAERLKAY